MKRKLKAVERFILQFCENIFFQKGQQKWTQYYKFGHFTSYGKSALNETT